MKGKGFKYFFIVTAILIAISSVWVTNQLVDKLKKEERRKIEMWAESIRLLSTFPDTPNVLPNGYLGFLLTIIEDNKTIPLIHTDSENRVIDSRNFQLPEENREAYLNKKILAFKSKHDPIVINLGHFRQYVYYDDSTVLKQLQWFPFIQLGVVFIFILISFLALNSTRKAEQNKLWVGLSKETAHQLGTPISSLMAWVEYLKTKEMDSHLLDEMDKDVQRLSVIAERFSKIGSTPDTTPTNLKQAMENAVGYMGTRISSKVSITIDIPDNIEVSMNESLFGWTIENLIKNAVDAMDGVGKIEITASTKGKRAIIDISDSGKGIPRNNFEAIFQPGYTTKARGWGLGLSLVRRIIESYQKGKIYVERSEPGKGTTFRIEL